MLRCNSVRQVGDLQRSALALASRIPALLVASNARRIIGRLPMIRQGKITEDFHAPLRRQVAARKPLGRR